MNFKELMPETIQFAIKRNQKTQCWSQRIFKIIEVKKQTENFDKNRQNGTGMWTIL